MESDSVLYPSSSSTTTKKIKIIALVEGIVIAFLILLVAIGFGLYFASSGSDECSSNSNTCPSVQPCPSVTSSNQGL